jgi:hypothetical protein
MSHIYNNTLIKIIEKDLNDSIHKTIFGDEPAQTFAEKTATPEEIFKDIQDAMDILWPKKQPSFRDWECLKFHHPILKNAPVIISNICV